MHPIPDKERRGRGGTAARRECVRAPFGQSSNFRGLRLVPANRRYLVPPTSPIREEHPPTRCAHLHSICSPHGRRCRVANRAGASVGDATQWHRQGRCMHWALGEGKPLEADVAKAELKTQVNAEDMGFEHYRLWQLTLQEEKRARKTWQVHHRCEMPVHQDPEQCG
jgi:hypothetical protein